jgi:hypothetical protein
MNVRSAELALIDTVTGFINALPGNSSVNTVQHATIDEAVFSTSSAPSSGGTTRLCNQFLSNGSVNTFPRKRSGVRYYFWEGKRWYLINELILVAINSPKFI